MTTRAASLDTAALAGPPGMRAGVEFSSSTQEHRVGEVFLRDICGVKAMLGIEPRVDGSLVLVLMPLDEDQPTIAADLLPLLHAMAAHASSTPGIVRLDRAALADALERARDLRLAVIAGIGKACETLLADGRDDLARMIMREHELTIADFERADAVERLDLELLRGGLG